MKKIILAFITFLTLIGIGGFFFFKDYKDNEMYIEPHPAAVDSHSNDKHKNHLININKEIKQKNIFLVFEIIIFYVVPFLIIFIVHISEETFLKNFFYLLFTYLFSTFIVAEIALNIFLGSFIRFKIYKKSNYLETVKKTFKRHFNTDIINFAFLFIHLLYFLIAIIAINNN